MVVIVSQEFPDKPGNKVIPSKILEKCSYSLSVYRTGLCDVFVMMPVGRKNHIWPSRFHFVSFVPFCSILFHFVSSSSQTFLVRPNSVLDVYDVIASLVLRRIFFNIHIFHTSIYNFLCNSWIWLILNFI